MGGMKRFEVSSFRPAWWLPGPHLQTLGARWLRSKIEVPLERERLELPDGDFVDLDFAFGRPEAGGGEGRPIVLVLHGLEGSARSGYALVLYRSLVAAGPDWRQPILNAIVTRPKGQFPLSQSKLAEMLGL